MATPIPRAAFAGLAPAVRHPCGADAHPLHADDLRASNAFLLGRHDRFVRARHAGWHTDAERRATLAGHVYVHEPRPAADDEDAKPVYLAAALSDEDDVHWLDPDSHDNPVDAAIAADGLAQTIAEFESACDARAPQPRRAPPRGTWPPPSFRATLACATSAPACSTRSPTGAPRPCRSRKTARRPSRPRPTAGRPGATAGRTPDDAPAPKRPRAPRASPTDCHQLTDLTTFLPR